MQTYEALGDRRSRAITLGDIANILAGRGEADQALQFHREEMQTYKALGDQDSIAATSFEIAQIYLARTEERPDPAALQAASEALAESYRINLSIGRLDGICAAGALLGQVLAAGGQHDEAKAVLVRSRDGFRKLGRPGEAAQMEELLRRLG
jgi:hypothetical protein